MFKSIIEFITIARSGLFDRDYYLTRYPDVRKADMNPLWHFVRLGWKEGRNPSERFNTRVYFIKHPEIDKDSVNPLIHFLQENKETGQSNDAQNYKEALSENKFPAHTDIFVSADPGTITFYLHTGDSKTGTSLIQNFLDVNRTKLFTEQNCLYPNFAMEDFLDGRCHNHAPWYQEVEKNPQKFRNDIQSLANFARYNNVEKIILSNEAWFMQEKDVELLKQIADICKDFRLVTISYLRRVDSWLESAWKQWGLKNFESVDEYTQSSVVKDRYKKILTHLEQWEEIIGNENIIVRPYEKGQLPGGLLQDFLSIVNINYQDVEWDPIEPTNLALNQGFNRDVLEMIYHCKDLFTGTHDNHVFDLFYNLLGEKFQKKPFEDYALLSPRQKLTLIQENMPYEKQIAHKFMNREDGRIFYDPLPGPDMPWEPYPGLVLEKAVPMMVKMLDEIYQLTLKNRDRLDHIEKDQG